MTPSEALRLREEFSHYRRSHPLLHEESSGRVIEYRRVFTPDRPAVFLEYRLLAPGGVPYPDGWYLVDDRHRLYMDYTAPEVLAELSGMKEC